MASAASSHPTTATSAAPSEPSEQKILVVGATGTLGRATVRSLVKAGFSVVAGSRDPSSSKAKQLSSSGVQLFEMSGPDSVKSAARGCTAAVVIPPGVETRAKWAVDVAENLRAAGLNKIIVISVPNARPDAEFYFGREFGGMEKRMREKGITPCIIRLPMFMENLFMLANAIKRDGVLRWRPRADALYSPITVDDIGDAIAALVTKPEDEIAGKEFVLCGPSFSANDIVETVSTVTGKKVTVEHIDDGAFLKAVREVGMEEWQAKGLLELMQLVDRGELDIKTKDLQALLGRPPRSLEQFVRGEFQRAIVE